MLPPAARRSRPVDSIPARHLHSSLNKVKHPVNVVKWTPEGRRLLTGSTSGEFTLWNGTGFNFETIMQAHDCALRAATYSHNNEWLISADQDGIVKYWQTNFNNVKGIQAHTDPIRDLAFAPTDTKFVTASDDATLKIFDFAGGVEDPKRLLLFFLPFWLVKLTELLLRLLLLPLGVLTGVAGGDAICRGGGCKGAGCWTPLLRSSASISSTDRLMLVCPCALAFAIRS